MHAVCGCIFPGAFAGAQHVLSISLSDDSPSGHSKRNRQCAHCMFIPCSNVHYYISQEMHAFASSYWHRKVSEFLPTFGETVR